MAPPELLQQQQKVKTVPIALVAAVGAATIAVALWALSLARSQNPDEAAAANSPAAASAQAGDPAAGAEPSAMSAPVAATDAGAAAASASTTPAAGTTPPPAGAPGSATAAPATPQGNRSLLGRASDAVRSAVNTLVGSKDAPAPAMAAQPSAEAKTAAAPRTTSRRRAATTTKPAAAASVPPALVAVAPFAPVTVATTQEPVVEPPPSVPPFDAPIEVYTASDSSVTPAVIVRPVLPKELPPGVPPEQVGNIEVIVDENGDVLHVKLLSPANRFHERMLVSAAKMWKFRPAYKDGRAVRYRTQVRLTI